MTEKVLKACTDRKKYVYLHAGILYGLNINAVLRDENSINLGFAIQ